MRSRAMRMRGIAGACAASLALLGLAGCIGGTKFPGKQVIGTYDFRATQTGGDCHFSDQPDGGFDFEGTFSYDPGTPTAYFTVNEVTRSAALDGGVLTSEGTGPRIFAECACGQNVSMHETLTVALLSQSQRAATDGGCPENPLDGGVPAPDPDAGILAPGPTASAYDAPLVCGVQVDQVSPGEGCQCAPCSLVYRVAGSRH